MCHLFGVSKNFMLERVLSRYPIELLFSHSTGKHRRGTFLCFRSFLVSKNVKDTGG